MIVNKEEEDCGQRGRQEQVEIVLEVRTSKCDDDIKQGGIGGDVHARFNAISKEHIHY